MKRCTVCTHPQKGEVDAAIISGEPQRSIAGRFDLSRAALGRHARTHLATTIAAATSIVAPEVVAQVRAEVDHGARALATFTRSLSHLEGLIEAYMAGLKTEKGEYRPLSNDDVLSAARLLKVLHSHLSVVARVQAALAEASAVDVTQSADWFELRGVIVEALEPFPEAAEALSAAIGRRFGGRATGL